MIGHKRSFARDLGSQWEAQTQIRAVLGRIDDQLHAALTDEQRRPLLRQQRLLNEQLYEADLADFVRARLEDHLKVLMHSGTFVLNDDMDE